MKHLAFGLLLGLNLSPSARADVVANPKIFFNVSPDLPVQASLNLSAVSLESQALNCTLQIQADLRYANDTAAQGTLLLPNIKYRVEASGTDTEPTLIGEDHLINQGVPGLRYSGGRVLGFTCATDRPSWEVELPAGKEYFLVYARDQDSGLQFVNPKTRAEETKGSEDILPYYTYKFSPDGSKILGESWNDIRIYSYPSLEPYWSIDAGEFGNAPNILQQARFSHDGRYVIASIFNEVFQTVSDGSLKVYDIIDRKMLSEIRFPALQYPHAHSGYLNDLFYSAHFDISPQGDKIVVAKSYDSMHNHPFDTGATVYSFPKLEKIAEFGSAGASRPTFSKDGKNIALQIGSSVVLHDSTTYKETARVNFNGQVFAYSFTPTGNNIVAATRTSAELGTIGSAEKPKILWVSSGRTSIPYTVSVSPDGKYAAVRRDAEPDDTSRTNSILTVPLDGGAPKWLENSYFMTATFSPVR
jgi:hypothetical protein